MVSQKKKLKNYNKAIAKGRYKCSLHTALAILAGFGIARAFTGGFLSWALFGAWISFLIIFIITYVMWPNNITKAQKIVDELGEGAVVSAPAHHKGYLIISIIIFVILALPITFKGQFAKWVVKQQNEAIIEVSVSAEGEEAIALNIPQLYVIKDHNPDMKSLFFENEVSNFTLVATLDDMKPLPVATKEFSSFERHKQTPLKNPNIISLTFKNTSVGLNSKLVEEAKQAMMKKFPNLVDTGQKYGLNFVGGKIPVTTNGRSFEQFVELGTSSDPAYENMVLICEKQSCQMMSNIPPLGIARISIHSSQAQNWKQVYDKSHALIKSFVVSK